MSGGFEMPNLSRRTHDDPDGADHGHGPHRHGAGPDSDPRWLWAALALILGFMAAEIVTGLAAHSLALISDAAHMLTDAASLALVLITMRLAARPAAGRYTYGLKRTEILSAQANGITLVVLSVWLAYEAVRRLVSPPPVTGGVVVAVALAGVVVNAATTWFITRASRAARRSLNLEGAFRHLLTDVFAFIATAVAGVVIVMTGFTRADAIASLVVVALMLAAGSGLLRDSGRIFLEAAPAALAPAEIGAAMVRQPDVTEVHDLHVWEISSDLPAASAHVLVAPGRDCHAVRADLEALLSREYGITHTTLQVDHARGPLLTVGPPPPAAAPGTRSGTQCGERDEREVAEHGPGDEDHGHGGPQPAGTPHPDHWAAAPGPGRDVQPGQHGDQQHRPG
ncbi:MAG TPA: cation diffusion facilitator family transporter [Streptosporangiaceae bacterium]